MSPRRAALISAGTRTTIPPVSMLIDPHLHWSSCSAVRGSPTTRWAKGSSPADGSISRPSRAARRHPVRCCGVRPWRCATALTFTPGSKLSATICALTSSGQLRRPVGPSRTSSRLMLLPAEANKCCTVCSNALLQTKTQSSLKSRRRKTHHMGGAYAPLTKFSCGPVLHFVAPRLAARPKSGPHFSDKRARNESGFRTSLRRPGGPASTGTRGSRDDTEQTKGTPHGKRTRICHRNQDRLRRQPGNDEPHQDAVNGTGPALFAVRWTRRTARKEIPGSRRISSTHNVSRKTGTIVVPLHFQR